MGVGNFSGSNSYTACPLFHCNMKILLSDSVSFFSVIVVALGSLIRFSGTSQMISIIFIHPQQTSCSCSCSTLHRTLTKIQSDANITLAYYMKMPIKQFNSATNCGCVHVNEKLIHHQW